MIKKLLLLSGPMAAGKTTLAERLDARFKVRRISTRQLIQVLEPTVGVNRLALQRAGRRLDRRTNGEWVARALVQVFQEHPHGLVAIDCARTVKQIQAVRRAFGPSALVYHAHLTASEKTLRKRYLERKRERQPKDPSYKQARNDQTEKRIERLAPTADLVIDTDRDEPQDVEVRVAGHLGLYGRGREKLVDVLIGGQYGSEGKGNIASYLARDYDLLVRVGGPNAGHTVALEPEKMTYHLLPSGTLHNERARLVLAPGMVLSVETLMAEVGKCDVSHDRLVIDPQCMIIENDDLKNERRLKRDIASTGVGAGSATARRITGRRDRDSLRLAKHVPELRPFLKPTAEVFEDAFREGNRILIEGTQGTGLSIYHGHYPWVTSRDTTVSGCLAESGIAPSRVRRIVMVCRTYPIRVESPAGKGKTSGPMTLEINWKEVSRRSGVPLKEILETEITSTTKRKRRVSEFDWALFRRAVSLNGPTDIALTFADYLSVKNRTARRFEQLRPETIRFVEELERVAAAPVCLLSTGFHSRCIIDRRAW